MRPIHNYGKQQVGKVKNFNLLTYEPDFNSTQVVNCRVSYEMLCNNNINIGYEMLCNNERH